MDIQGFKLGNLIKINPRGDEEGILFITDIQKSSIIGEMVYPRQGYHFRIQFNEVLPVEVSDKWLSRLGFSNEGQNDVWVDPKQLTRFKFSASGSGFLENEHITIAIHSIHELQNSYSKLTENC